jgi:hypothetical protein
MANKRERVMKRKKKNKQRGDKLKPVPSHGIAKKVATREWVGHPSDLARRS